MMITMNPKRRLVRPLALIGALSLALTACGGGSGDDESPGADGETIHLDAMFNMPAGSPQETALRDIIENYESENNVVIDMEVPGDFEGVLKVKLAAQDIPDIFSTHGWSVLRYGEFLEPLTDQPWMDNFDPGLDTTMRDENDDILALPLEYSIAGLIVNFDVLEEANVDPEAITTWADFDEAAKQVKDDGVAPIAAAGKESGDGNLADLVASGWFDDSDLEKFSAGTFVTDGYTEILTLLEDWSDAGYYNPDFAAATIDDTARMLATGEAAFTFAQPTVMTQALEYDNDANIGFIPFPGHSADGQYLVGGEGLSTFGVSKSSEHIDAAKDFLNYLAQPEVADGYLKVLGTYSGLTNVEVDLGSLQPSYDRWVGPGEIPTMPFFDRASLPGGMWSPMKSTASAVITGQEAPKDAVKTMVTQFDSLYAQE